MGCLLPAGREAWPMPRSGREIKPVRGPAEAFLGPSHKEVRQSEERDAPTRRNKHSKHPKVASKARFANVPANFAQQYWPWAQGAQFFGMRIGMLAYSHPAFPALFGARALGFCAIGFGAEPL